MALKNLPIDDSSIELAVWTVLVAWTLFRCGQAIYSLYFHPLSKFPGPPLAAVSLLPATFKTFQGRPQVWVADQHRHYGPVVRIRPNELSFITDAAWKDIYSHQPGYPQMPKVLRTKPINGAPSLMSAGDADHARQRKLLSHAFSDQALRDQEPLLRSYADLLISQISKHAGAKGGTDMVEWLTYATFDIVADLSFGSSFGNLANSRPHPWVSTFKSGIKQGILFVAFRSMGIPLVDSFLARFISPVIQAKRHEQAKHASSAVGERLDRTTERPDFLTNFLRANDMSQIPRDEIDSIFTIVALAGCESPATALSGAVYHLLKSPDAYRKLREEIRSLPADEDLSIANLSRMPYLRAVLDESLRMYPPVPAAMDRVVPGAGKMISGYWVPGGTWVGVPQIVANHSPTNFAEPDTFIPERYLEKHDKRFRDDNRAVVQPFSLGPRNCIGQNLAKAEMKLILAKLVWHFDMELVDKEEGWVSKQHIYGLWDKEPLMVKIALAPKK